MKQQSHKEKTCLNCDDVIMSPKKYGKKYAEKRNYCSKRCGAIYANKDNITTRKYSYSGIHLKLRELYKKTGVCEQCKEKPETRTEFALKKGKKYTLNRDDYFELCGSCHRKYDLTDETRKKLSNHHKGKPNPHTRKQFVCDKCNKPHRAKGLCEYHYFVKRREDKQLNK